MATRFVPKTGPPLEELGLRPHDYARAWDGYRFRCLHCPLPKTNRVHKPSDQRRAEWAEYDAARLGERDR